MPVDNYYTLKLHSNELKTIFSKNIIEKVIIHKPIKNKNQYVALFNIFFAGVDRNSGWIELWTDGTFRKQPPLEITAWQHHIQDKRYFDVTLKEHDIINKLNNWSSGIESKYEIRPPPVYPATYQRPQSKGQKRIKNPL